MKCRTCPARIMWATTAKGEKIPLDVAPRKDGNLWLSGGVAVAVDMLTPPDAPRYVSHFATCPDAAVHRKP